MEDTKRGSGRTTRMILAAYNYVLRTHNNINPPKAEVVVHSLGTVQYIENMLKHIVPSSIVTGKQIGRAHV